VVSAVPCTGSSPDQDTGLRMAWWERLASLWLRKAVLHQKPHAQPDDRSNPGLRMNLGLCTCPWELAGCSRSEQMRMR
jgi:hypothetical protein